MNILFYYPLNKRTIPIDVPLLALKNRGHVIFLLTHSQKGPLHELYGQHGIQTFSQKGNTKIALLIEFIFFCKRHKIDVVHSHLQQTNLIACLAKIFLHKTKIIFFRHHCKYDFLLKKTNLKIPWKERLADKIINLMAQKIVVPAQGVANTMINQENVSKSAIKVLRYMYHFGEMQNVNKENIQTIKSHHQCALLIIMVSRLTPYKRHMEALIPICQLIKEGLDIHLIIMDDGPTKASLEKYVVNQALQGHIYFMGFRKDILDFIAASDVIVHPSLTDASNSAIKEAGLFKKIAIVCDKVGDFNDYIIHEENGFLLDPNKFSEELYFLLKEIYQQHFDKIQLGSKLCQSVTEKFSFSQRLIEEYENL